MGLLFYDSPLAAAILFVVLLFIYYPREKQKQMKKKKEQLSQYFKETLHSVLAALKAGYSVENAFVEAYGDMNYRFGAENVMVKELLYINRQVKNNIPIERLMETFGRESGVDDIRDFGRIFPVAKRSGGDMSKVIERSISMITRRMEIKEDIRILVAAKKYEQQIMNLVPMGIILYIRVSNPGYFDSLYHQVAGILVMTGALGIYITAYGMSEKILEIT